MPPIDSPKTEIVEFCPVCGSEKRRLFCIARDRFIARAPRDKFTYHRCLDCNCGVLYQSKRPTEAAAGDHYPSDTYTPYENKTASSITSNYAKFRQKWFAWTQQLAGYKTWTKRVKLAYRLPRAGARVLDFGCGSAKFLNQMRTEEWETCGSDFNPDVLQKVAAEGHETMPVSAIAAGTMEGAFDAVRMSHVVEHLYAPADMMKSLAKILRPGGVLHLATPNSASWSCRLFRRFWLNLDAPRHTMIYTPKSLRRLLKKAGFSNIKFYYESKPADSRRSLTYVLSSLGLGRTPGAELPIQSMVDLFIAPFCGLATKSSRSSRMHVIARK